MRVCVCVCVCVCVLCVWLLPVSVAEQQFKWTIDRASVFDCFLLSLLILSHSVTLPDSTHVCVNLHTAFQTHTGICSYKAEYYEMLMQEKKL